MKNYSPSSAAICMQKVLVVVLAMLCAGGMFLSLDLFSKLSAGLLALYLFFNLKVARIPLSSPWVRAFWGLLAACVILGFCFIHKAMYPLGIVFVFLVQLYAPVWGKAFHWNEAPYVSYENAFMTDEGEIISWQNASNKNAFIGTLMLCLVFLMIWLIVMLAF